MSGVIVLRLSFKLNFPLIICFLPQDFESKALLQPASSGLYITEASLNQLRGYLEEFLFSGTKTI